MLPSRSEHDFVDRRNVIPKVIHVLQLHLGLFALGVITEYQVAPLRGALLPLQMLLVPVVIHRITAGRQYTKVLSCIDSLSSPIQSGHCALFMRRGKGSGSRDSLISTYGRCRI